MGLNIKNPEVERLAAEVAALTGESKTEAIRVSLVERRERMAKKGRQQRIHELKKFLETEVWPSLPADVRGVGIRQEDQDAILGYGPGGYSE